ncbi:UNVERIFIED_CONTAM: hypothetical protein HDU68_011109 [Siphonaria sp. JEL0065]|nr:hypothetical protein HDU68_011109 [Siphonaria sp. JEL0065]
MSAPALVATGKTLGEGSYAVVKEAVIDTGERFAAKVFQKQQMKGQEQAILNEIEILKTVSQGHRNIVSLHDYFETPNNLYLVMDLCTGGELFDRIVERGSFYEEDAADIIKTVLSATAYLHANHIVHRDLKPENILFRSKDSNELVIADFGLSKIANSNETNLRTVVGTYGYMAPEVLRRGGYTSSVDVWSIGVIAYFLLSGYTPFDGQNQLQDILDGRYAFDEDYWYDISRLARDFIARTIIVDPHKRMTAEEALEHPWIIDYAPAPKESVPAVQRARTKDLLPDVKKNAGKDKFRAVVATVMASNRIAQLTSGDTDETNGSPHKIKFQAAVRAIKAANRMAALSKASAQKEIIRAKFQTIVQKVIKLHQQNSKQLYPQLTLDRANSETHPDIILSLVWIVESVVGPLEQVLFVFEVG